MTIAARSQIGRRLSWDRLIRLRRARRLQTLATFGVVMLGPMLALATFLVLGPLELGFSSLGLRTVLLLDLVYVLIVAGLVLGRVVALISARRARSAGSRLHLRLTGAFAAMALLPTVTVAVFATITVNFGLEGWFSDRVSRVIGASLAAAEAYEDEHRRDLAEDAQALGRYIDAARQAAGFLPDGNLRQILAQGQGQVQRGLREAFIVDGSGELRTRGERSYLFDFERPTRAQLAEAADTGLAVIEDWDQSEFRALVPLSSFVDRYLYVSRAVDGALLSLLDETQSTAQLYQQLERDRGRLLFEFGLLYLGFALILILASVWLGLWFAERLSRPVGRLAGAAQKVGDGDLNVQVPEEEGDDEIAMLGRYFNRMTHQLRGQRDALLINTRQIERRRRLFDSVLTSVTSGVVGLDAKGRVTFVNRSAERLLQLDEGQETQPLSVAVPEFGPLLAELRKTKREVAQAEVKVTRAGRLENLLVRLSTRRNEDGRLEGYVVAFDDVTDLVSAQRMAAWGDVARRIAHEIKNPLTPIQLSAERIRRKFRAAAGDEADKLDQMTEVIIRQTGDLRRIVDEFSQFARMPEPVRREADLTALVNEAVLLQQAGQPGVRISADLPDGPLPMLLDETMIRQALTNLIKNSGEAIETRIENGDRLDESGRIEVTLSSGPQGVEIRICDNGIGLPEDRARLFEPYVTTREKGTGLGLPIVRKIIEEHGGTLTLADPDPDTGPATGACAIISLPVDGAAIIKNTAERDHE